MGVLEGFENQLARTEETTSGEHGKPGDMAWQLALGGLIAVGFNFFFWFSRYFCAQLKSYLS